MNQRRPGPPPDLDGMSVVEVLGTGGFSDVFKYHQLDLGRDVAVKVLLPGLVDQGSFRDEAKVMAQLSNHPSIVTIHHPGVTRDGRPYLVMEFCPQAHLGARIRSRPLSVAQALAVTVQIAGAVETAHRLGIVHRDIKPANILFSEFGRPQLTDFGISVTTGAAEAGTGIGMSVPWAPPEQLRTGAPMGPSGDVYSLAATLWTTLVGRSPFYVVGGDNGSVAMAERVRRNPVPATGRDDVPESLHRILRTAMSKEAGQRFQSALELARALQGVQVELHHPVSQIEVRDERMLDDGADDEGQGGTRVTGFIAIDPEGATPRGAPPTRPAVPAPSPSPSNTVPNPPPRLVDALPDAPSGEAEAATQLGRGAVVQDPVPVVAPGIERPAGSRGRVLAGVGLAAAAAAVVAVLVTTSGGTHATSKPQEPDQPVLNDPIQEGLPVPTGIVVRRLDQQRLRVTWDPAEAGSGETFQYAVVDPAEPLAYRPGRAPVVVRAGPGKVCVRVVRMVVGEPNSDSALACWEPS